MINEEVEKITLCQSQGEWDRERKKKRAKWDTGIGLTEYEWNRKYDCHQYIQKKIENTEKLKLHREMWKISLETETIISLALYVVVVNVGYRAVSR